MKLYSRVAYVILFSLVLFSSCNPRSNQVWFTELQSAHSIQQKSVERIYLDKNGHLYPSKEIYIPYKEFYDPCKKGHTHENLAISGSLEEYYTGRSCNQCKKKSEDLYDYIKRSEELKKVYNLSNDLSLKETFDTSQAIILAKVAQSLNDDLAKTTSKTLVIFVHGFNDPNPSPDYERLRSRIEAVTELNDLVYLEVYWNGLTANQGHPGKSKIWGAAQFNSCETAVTIRQVLNKINDGTNVRIIAHSTGASVMTSALFNTTNKWKNIDVFPRYSKMIKTIPAPLHLNIHLGFLAPAIPGTSTFMDFNQRDSSNFDNSKNNIQRIIVGFNFNDYAVTKRLFGKDFLSDKFGSTSLGADHDGEINKTKNKLAELGYSRTLMQEVPFNDRIYGSVNEEHGVYYFMQNEEKFKSYIQLLFSK